MGVYLTTSSETGEDLSVGTGFAVASSFLFPLRNILLKQLAVNHSLRPEVTLIWASHICFACSAAVYSVKYLLLGSEVTFEQLAVALCFVGYQVASVQFLSLTSAATHSVFNLIKRVTSLVLTVVFFESSPPQNFLSGILVTFIGIGINISLNQGVIHSRFLSAAIPTMSLICLCSLVSAAGSGHFFGEMQLSRPPVKELTGTENYASVSIWAYPEVPPLSPTGEVPDFCLFHTCLEESTSSFLDIFDLARDKHFEFLRTHALQKIKHQQNFSHHLQAIAVISFSRANKLTCVRTYGNAFQVCHHNASQAVLQYDPLSHELPPDVLMVRGRTPMPSIFNAMTVDTRTRKINLANSGDEIQSIAGVQFLPCVNHFVDREIGLPRAEGFLWGNAWWGKFELPLTSARLNITLVAAHFNDMSLIEKNIEWFRGYVRENGPIGARDTGTLEGLKELGIPAYFSACMTLMMSIRNPTRNMRGRRIFVVDVNSAHLPVKVLSDPDVEFITANYPRYNNTVTRLERFEYAFSILDKYAQDARLVITSRIHSALPAIALGVPVIFVDSPKLPGGGGNRTAGLLDLFHVYKPNDPWTFDTLNLSRSPAPHVIDRKRAAFWHKAKKQNRFFTDSARVFKMIPLERLGATDVEPGLEFHFLLGYETIISFRMLRSLESVLFHHPNSKVTIHSGLNVSFPVLETLLESGYDVSIVNSFPSIFQKDGLDGYGACVTNCFYNSSDHCRELMKSAIAQFYGGVVLEWTALLLKELPSDVQGIGYSKIKNEIDVASVVISHSKPSMPAPVDYCGAGRLPGFKTLSTDMFTSLNESEASNCIAINARLKVASYIIDIPLQAFDANQTDPHGSLCWWMSDYCIFCDEAP